MAWADRIICQLVLKERGEPAESNAMFRTAAALFAKKTAIVAITGVTVIGGASLALANTDLLEDPAEEEASAQLVVEETGECEPADGGSDDPTDDDTTDDSADDTTDDSGDDATDESADDASTDDSTGDDDDVTAAGCEGDDASSDEGVAGDEGTGGDDAGDGPLAEGGKVAVEEGDASTELMDPDTDDTAYANHGEAVSAYAKEHCKSEAARAEYKNHGQCVREAARSDLGKQGEADGATSEETTDEAPLAPAETPVVTETVVEEPAPAPRAVAPAPKPAKEKPAAAQGGGKAKKG